MGNIVQIRDKNGDLIAEASHSLLCYSYFTKVAGKYNPIFLSNAFILDNINEEMEKVYSQATPEDEIVCLIFINTENHFTQEHVPALKKAIEDYPEGYHEGPLRILTKMLALLEEYGELHTEYVGVTAGFSVHRA